VDLSHRIRQLERQCRILRTLVGGLVAAVAVMFLAAAAPPKDLPNLQVQRLDIVDATGKVRISLGCLTKH
jgi:hypothetical protein